VLLEDQRANPFRVRAYRRAAEVVRGLERPVHAILADQGRDGRDGLDALPGIGESLASTIEQLVHTDHLALLDRLRGEAGSDAVFATVPGIGAELARRIGDQLGIESLPELERAAHDGRLATVPGMGPRRVRAVVESLAGRFRRQGRARAPLRPDEPTVAELLDVDAEYRRKAEAGELPRIAPRRFNPGAEVWLPVLHTHRGRRHYTALYSNTARAHELGRTRDWVVIYRDDDHDHRQWTVVTSRAGPLRGKRVVRGREAEQLAG